MYIINQSSTKAAGMYNEKRTLSLINGKCWGKWIPTCKRVKLDSLQHKQKSTRNELKLELKTWNCKTLEKMLFDIGLGHNFSDMTPKTQATKAK